MKNVLTSYDLSLTVTMFLSEFYITKNQIYTVQFIAMSVFPYYFIFHFFLQTANMII